MKGILIVSHGEMASGMMDSASLFFGEKIEQLDHLCLEKDDDPSVFGLKVKEKIKQLDCGDGVIIFADLYGGTPCNQAILQLDETVELISGMNFSMLLELLSSRTFMNPSLDSLIEIGKSGIKNVKEELLDLENDEDE